MIFGNSQQKKEIKTIREKKISVNLSEADCERISNLCGEYNMSVGELLANFIGDLVNGTYTNGSDEVDFAQKYIERCGFSMFAECTLKNWILSGYDYSAEDVYDLLDNIQTGTDEQAYLNEHPDEADPEELEFLKTDMEEWENELGEIKAAYKKANPDADWDAQVADFVEWWTEKERLKHE